MEVLASFSNIREHEITNRKKDLAAMDIALKEFKESNFFDDLMATQALQDLSNNKALRSKRNIRKFSVNCYCFGLLSSLVLVLVVFSLQLLFSFVKTSLDHSTIQHSISSMDSINLSNDILDRSFIGLNAVL